jgi:hypothetical protein
MSNKFLVMAAALAIAGCAANQPQLAPLEIQALQQREYEANKAIVFPSVLSVFQDLGFLVGSADLETGFITFSSPTENATNFGEALIGMRSQEQTAGTAFVENRPGGSRVRLNFVSRRASSGAYGQSSNRDTPIYDGQMYQNAFERIDEAIFVRQGSN